MSSPIVRLPAVALVGFSAWLAVRNGGGLDAATPPPRAKGAVASGVAPGGASSGGSAPHATAQGARAGAGDAFEVQTRLIDRIREARYEVPAFEKGRVALRAHWRKMPVPWTRLQAGIAERVTSIALRTSATETQ